MIISKTPFRISFFGGGTDYPEYFTRHPGAVLGTAIDKFCYVSATRLYSKLFDYKIRLAYRQVECVPDLESIQHAPFRECLRTAGITEGIEVDYMAELPSSTGLGTSSSFVVGVLNTLAAVRGELVHPLDLAYRAIDLERNVLGETVGCQDQTLAAMGGFNLCEFRNVDDIRVHRLSLSPQRMAEFNAHLMLVYTGIRRRASDVAAKQVKKIDRNTSHLSQMRKLVDDGYELLTGRGSLDGFGQMLHDAWTLKHQLDAGVSNPQINEMYETGLANGAWGGKLLGAGGGEFLLFFAPPERQAAIRQAFADYEEIPISINAAGTRIIHAETNSFVDTDAPEVEVPATRWAA